MKKLIVINIIITITITLKAQNLTEVYKHEKINLVEVEDFAQGNNWDEIFHDYNEKAGARPIGLMRYIEVKDNGLIFLTRRASSTVLEFDKNGKYISQFQNTISKSKTTNEEIFNNEKDDKYLVYGDYVKGTMAFFDLDGNFIKSQKVNYGVTECFPLRNGKYAHVGFVVWAGGKIRRISVISDIHTDDHKIVFSHLSDGCSQRITVKMGKGLGMITMPYKDNIISRRTTNGNLLVAFNNIDEIKIISPKEETVKKIHLNFTPRGFTKNDRDEFKKQVNLTEFSGTDTDGTQKRFKPSAEELKKLDDPDFYPKHLPYFYDLRVDSENNLLVFIYTENEINPTFRAYSIDTGEFLGQATLSSEEYEIKTNQIEFHNGYLYGILPLKNADGNPLRLVKFKLEAGN